MARIYLVRHGKASKDPAIPTDDERPLTERGRGEVEALAKIVAASSLPVHQIRHSGILRARQTAEIFGTLLKPPGGVVAVSGLHFFDPVAPLARDLSFETDPVMLVGHNPFMERLAAMMLTGSEERTVVSMATSSVACFEGEIDNWVLKWALHRELVGQDDRD